MCADPMNVLCTIGKQLSQHQRPFITLCWMVSQQILLLFLITSSSDASSTFLYNQFISLSFFMHGLLYCITSTNVCHNNVLSGNPIHSNKQLWVRHSIRLNLGQGIKCVVKGQWMEKHAALASL